MAHNLNTNKKTGKVSMFYYGEAPWHKLGQKLDKPATAEEAIKAAGLDYTVTKMPLRANPGPGKKMIEVPNYFATVRTDTMDSLGVVGNRYEPLQNRDAFRFFDSLVGKGEAIYHTAGALGKGEKIWIMAKLPDYIRIGKNDVVEKFLLLTNGHDGRTLVRAKLTPIRVVCENTLNMAMRGSDQQVGVMHNSNTVDTLETAWKVLGLTNKLYDELGAIFNTMSLTKITDKQLVQYVTELVYGEEAERSTRKEAQKERILQLAHEGKGSEFESSKGTIWGAYNAATEFADHVDGEKRNEEAVLKSLWFGAKEEFKVRAYNMAIALVNN